MHALYTFLHELYLKFKMSGKFNSRTFGSYDKYKHRKSSVNEAYEFGQPPIEIDVEN